MPRIRVNGATRDVADGTTVAALLRILSLPLEGVAVEVNRTILPRSRHAETRVDDGDEIEIVTFVGGG